jgi:Branched-chain amino acid transport protein (AzlD)
MNFIIEPYLALVLLGVLPSEIWRWIGIVVGHGLDENSDVILWVRAVATALIAGVVARIILIPPGALASVPLTIRLAALGIGFLAFLVMRRSALAGVLAGEAALIAGTLAFGS